MASDNSSSTFKETLKAEQLRDSPHRFTLEFGLFVALLFGAFMIMVIDLGYNTLFLDEAINVVIGDEFLQGTNSRNALSFHFGSHLYPILSATVNKIGGVAAMRFTSTILICLAAVLVYLSARKLFGYKAALLSLMLFAFNGNILNLGQLAVYDALSLPLLAGASYLLVTASVSDKSQRRLMFASAVCAVLATLSKYIGLIHLPALFLTALFLFLSRGNTPGQALGKLFRYFLLPVILALGLYAALFWRELVQVFQEQGFSPAPRGLILGTIGQEIGIILFLALAGLVLLVVSMTRDRNPSFPGTTGVDWGTLSASSRVIFIGAVLVLLLAWLAAPLQQLLSANIRSLWKNSAYSLVFLAPIAGYLLSSFIEYFRSRKLALNLIGLVLFGAFMLYFADQSLDSNWSFHRSWPDTSGAVTYLQNANIDENTQILAEGMDIYEYYLGSEEKVQPVWNNFWYVEHGGETGQAGAFAAIHDRVFDYVIVEDYYIPGLRGQVTPVLTEAGYAPTWQESQTLRSGDTILLQIFTLGNGGIK